MILVRNVGLMAFAIWFATAGVQAENADAVNEVLRLKSSGIKEDTIVAFIQSKNVNYDLSADSILKLRDQGLSSDILNAMLASGKSSPPAAVQVAAPVAVQASSPTVQTQQVTYVPQTQTTVQTTVIAPAVVGQPVANPDVAYFYQELSPHGRWILTEDGQWCWQPSFVVGSADWRPYWDKGHWVWTDHGWYWASDYAWGWAAFHYGRWHLHPHHGWVWFPDRVWGPAWVAWRSGGDYCGWAPLPPGAIYDTAGGFFRFRGKHVEAGFDFGLGLVHFNFCYVKDMGGSLRERFHGEAERRAVFNHTTININYTVSHPSGGVDKGPQVFNHGIEPSRIPPGKGKRMEPVKIQDLQARTPGRSPERVDMKDRKIEVYRPRFNGHR